MADIPSPPSPLRESAAAGDTEAMTALGVFYREHGQFKEAMATFKDAGTAAAMRHLGSMCELGEHDIDDGGGKPDEEAAAEWYRQAAADGDSDAQIRLAMLRLTVSRFQSHADFLRQEAEGGGADAQYEYAEALAAGRDTVPRDPREAFRWYRRAGDQGHVAAQYELGIALASGNGCKRDPADAARWFVKAGEQGHSNAQLSLGFCFEKGHGVPRDVKKAAFWWGKAAEAGQVRAQYSMGICYAKGDGVKASRETAVAWWRRAAEGGLAEAQFNLAVCCENGEGVPLDKEEAMVWYHKAAEQGQAEAQYKLGLAYACGDGVDRSYNGALKWLGKAAELGHAAAAAAISRLRSLPQPVATANACANCRTTSVPLTPCPGCHGGASGNGSGNGNGNGSGQTRHRLPVMYCSVKCSRAHWATHSAVCERVPYEEWEKIAKQEAEAADKCAVCGKPKSTLFCSRCKTARYCSKECQRAAWKKHKKECVV